MEYSICQPRLLTYIGTFNNITKRYCNLIPTIWVESNILTASYYKQYLGFSIIFRNPLIKNGLILMTKKGNWIIIKKKEVDKQLRQQKLSIFLRNTQIEYSTLYNKVWVVKPFGSKDEDNFIIKDCNGIEIAYRSSKFLYKSKIQNTR